MTFVPRYYDDEILDATLFFHKKDDCRMCNCPICYAEYEITLNQVRKQRKITRKTDEECSQVSRGYNPSLYERLKKEYKASRKKQIFLQRKSLFFIEFCNARDCNHNTKRIMPISD